MLRAAAEALGLPVLAPPAAARSGPVPSHRRDHCAHFEFLGNILGKAALCGILVSPRFAYFVLLRLLGRPAGMTDLSSLDPELAHGLLELLRMADAASAASSTSGGSGSMGDGGGGAAAEDEVSALGLSMVANYVDARGRAREHELVPNGANVGVTAANARLYVARLAHFRLQEQIRVQADAFLRGFRELVPLPWMRMFGPSELQLLLSGEEVRDVPQLVMDLCQHCQLSGYGSGDEYMLTFWRVLAGFSPEDFSAFLSFVTSCPRPPLLGFKSLRPPFGIQHISLEQKAGESAASGVLPKAATCFNLLKLPFYGSETILREKLLTAIREGGGGFYLT